MWTSRQPLTALVTQRPDRRVLHLSIWLCDRSLRQEKEAWEILYWLSKPSRNIHWFPSHLPAVSSTAMPNFREAGRGSCALCLEESELEKEMNNCKDSQHLALSFWLNPRFSLLLPFQFELSQVGLPCLSYLEYLRPINSQTMHVTQMTLPMALYDSYSYAYKNWYLLFWMRPYLFLYLARLVFVARTSMQRGTRWKYLTQRGKPEPLFPLESILLFDHTAVIPPPAMPTLVFKKMWPWHQAIPDFLCCPNPSQKLTSPCACK